MGDGERVIGEKWGGGGTSLRTYMRESGNQGGRGTHATKDPVLKSRRSLFASKVL